VSVVPKNMTDACELYYEERGLNRGVALLFLHGFMGSLHDWLETAAALGEFRCILPDLAGHGQTSVGDADYHYTMAGACAALIRLADQLGVRRLTPIGYSMGGRLALYLALRYPDRCDRVVIESASPGLATEGEREQRRRWDASKARELESWDFSRFLRVWYAQPLFETLVQDQDRFATVLERRRQNDPGGLARSMRGMGTGAQSSLWPELERLDMPLLAISGELDQKYRKTMGDMVRLCQKGRHVVVPGAGHNVHCENPEIYTQVLREFLAEG